LVKLHELLLYLIPDSSKNRGHRFFCLGEHVCKLQLDGNEDRTLRGCPECRCKLSIVLPLDHQLAVGAAGGRLQAVHLMSGSDSFRAMLRAPEYRNGVLLFTVFRPQFVKLKHEFSHIGKVDRAQGA
jgi:hypothetical protein